MTDHVDLDAYPVFSPDGQWITFSSAGEIVTDWSPDGRSLLYSSSYDVPHSTIFQVDVATLQFTKLTEDMDALAYAQYSRDGYPDLSPRAPGTSPSSS